MSFSTASPLEAVRPLDPELLELGPAAMAQCFRKRDHDDNSVEAWRDDLAHAAALPLTAEARAAVLVAADRLSALLAAQQALEAAGLVLAEQLEAMDA